MVADVGQTVKSETLDQFTKGIFCIKKYVNVKLKF